MMQNGRRTRLSRGVALGVRAVCACLVLTGCARWRHDPVAASEPVPHVVTADIQAGIEAHIENATQKGGGHFPLAVDGKNLSLKLVRVHTEYLANLGPRRHFACVDMADISGDVYDVDFFLSGDPGAMTVTETTVHKINGKPFYFWEQQRDKTWIRVPATEASRELQGIVAPRDEFEFRYRVTLPEITAPAKLWIPLPATDAFQEVEFITINAPAKHRILKEREHGNKVLFWELGPESSREILDIRYRVRRVEKAAYADDVRSATRHLAAERLVPANQRFSEIAQRVVEGKEGDLVRARALYDHVIDTMRYMKYGEGWGQGDAIHACDARTGNCTDYHAYFIGLARSVGIPARFAIGAAVPSNRDEGGIDGYHCWVEFYAEGKWWPVDISEADKYSGLSSYYFGHNPANRLEFSRGRDLLVEPGPASGPINFLAYPVLEIDGTPVKAKADFSFHRTG